MQITTVGIDLAKNVFQIHGVNEHDRAMVRKQMRREQITAFFANLPPCSIRGLLAEYGLVVPQGIGNARNFDNGRHACSMAGACPSTTFERRQE